MKNKDDICVIIQARLGSQRIPAKMTKPFAGTTLLDIALEKIKNCKAFPLHNFHLSAWEPELQEIGHNHGVNVFERSEASAKSEGTPMTEMYEWWDKLPFKYGILINACCPFLTSETIDKFFTAYTATDSVGLFGVMEKKNYFWNENKEVLTPLTEAVMNTKTVQKTYEAAHCLYAGQLDKIGDEIWMGDFRIPGEIELFTVGEYESLDIDYQWQFDMCQTLWRQGIPR